MGWTLVRPRAAHVARIRAARPHIACLSTAETAASTSAPPRTTAESEKPRVIFSGIQPTGIPHLGNYLGALKNWKDLQDNALPNDTLLFSSVALHALTMPQNPQVLHKEREEVLATLLAIGLNPDRCIIFQQEDVAEHTLLSWILSCQASVGRLRRMTTWKSKIAIASGSSTDDVADDDDPEGSLNLGLFSYPVLQAADILLYRATHVPVGEDQIQHLELSRALAKRFNQVYKTRLFPPPAHLITPTARLSSLRDPSQKMSKSAPDANSRIMLTDSPDVVARKIKKAVTDSDRVLAYDAVARPGVATLLEIIASLTGATPAVVADELNSQTGGLVALKTRATEVVNESLRPIQAELQRIHQDPAFLDSVAKTGAAKAQERANQTMDQVRKAVGIL